MSTVLAAALFTAAGSHLGERTRMTPAEVAVQVRRLTDSPTETERARAARRLAWAGRSWAVREALPALERAAKTDPAGEVRGWCLNAIAKSAAADGKPMPAIVLDGVYDEYADNFAGTFSWPVSAPVDPQTVYALIRYAQSDNRSHRLNAALLLAAYAPHAPAAMTVLRSLTRDPDLWVRQNAHSALFGITDDLTAYFRHVLITSSEFGKQPKLDPAAPAANQTEHLSRTISWFGARWLIAGWVEDRPADVRAALAEMLTDRDRAARLVAAEFLCAAGMIRKGVLDAEPPRTPGLAPARKFDAAKHRKGLEVIARSDALRDRLKAVADTDPDPAVRDEADLARWVIETGDEKK